MRMLPWRPIVGPLFTLAIVSVIPLLDRYLFPVSNPGAISFLAVAFSAYLGGMASGLVAPAISIAYSTIYFSNPGEMLSFTPDNLARMLVLIVATPALAIMVGKLQARTLRALQHEHAMITELRALRSALDQSEVGVVLLDSELRGQFINRAYRRLWHLPDEVANSKPAFVDLMYHARDARAYAIAADKVDAYIFKRAALVQAGHEGPIDIRLANGDVIRFRCKALADGGRMLNYGNVSDLVRDADELTQLAMVDGMTGLCNRRYFLTRLDDEWSRYLRYRRPLSLLILDIDFFKKVNDTFGHDVGDQVIIHVARVCCDSIRNSDIAGRIGGEEFAVLLLETDIEEARVVAERVRNAISERHVQCGTNRIAVTVSIGAVAADANMNAASNLIKRADEALYAAKRAGRNRVASFPDPLDIAMERVTEKAVTAA